MTATGTIFEGYRLLRPLGKGWLGEVYAAQNLDGAAVGALRIVAPELSAQPLVMTQFRRLYQKWRQLAHPNVLAVGELYEREHRVSYAMHLAQHGSVRQLLQAQVQSGQFLDLLVVVDLARQVAAALAYAHDANLMHGNLKPENLLLNPARAILGRQAYGVMVSDFGVGELQSFTHGVHDRLIVTTPAYMSPEQCRGVRTEVTTDIYALGVVLYELLTNMVPFETRDLADASQKHQHVAPIPPGQIRLDIPQDLEEVVLTCLAKAPEYRYRSAHELETALQGILSQLLPRGPRPTLVLPDLPEPPAPRIEPLRDRTPYPRLQVVGADGQTIRIEPLQSPLITLGRAPGNTIVLEHAGVSRHHLSLDVEDDGVYVTDLASTNGTTLGGQALLPRDRTLWPDGGVLRVEPFWLRLQPPQKVVQQARIGVQVEDNDLTLKPGEPTLINVKLANTGRTVDHFRLEVEGVPPEWVQNLYHELQLNPGMTAQTTLRLLVPRTAQALADSYPVRVVARSRENPAEFGYAPMTWKVLPFTETQIEVAPRRRSAWRRTHYDLKIINASNVPIIYNPKVRDDEGQVHLQSPTDMIRVPQSGDLRNIIPVRTIIHNTWMRLREGIGKVNVAALPENIQVDPGSEFTHRIQVRLPIRWIAAPRQRTLKLHPHPSVGQDYAENLSLLHLPVIPLWALPLVLIFGVLLVLWLLQPPSIVTVSVVPVETSAQAAGQGQTTGQGQGQVQTIAAGSAGGISQQPRVGQPFYLDFETRNASRIVVKPWNKTLYRGTGRLLIPGGITAPVNAQVIVYGRLKTTQQALTVTPISPPPVIRLFTVSPENISTGQSATLRWDVGNAKDVTIEPLGTLPPKGVKQQKITGNTTFHLVARGAGGDSIDQTRTVSVLPASIDLFEVTPAQARIGDKVTIRWKVRNASEVTLDPLGTVESQGKVQYTVQGDQPFTLKAQVGDQALVKTASLKVLVPVAERLSVSPQEATVGDTVTVSWKVINASTVSMEPFGTVPASGQRQMVVQGNTTFHLTATNGQGSTDLGSVTVSTSAQAPSVTSFVATPRKPRAGQPVTLEWTSENAASAELSGVPGQGTLALPASGSTIISAPADASSLTLTVKSSDGASTSQMLALPVLPAAPAPVAASAASTAAKPTPTAGAAGATTPAPTPKPQVPVAPVPAQVVGFVAVPARIQSGQPVTLKWVTKNAQKVRIYPSGQVLPASGRLVVKPGLNTVYTLVAGTVRAQTGVVVAPKPVAQKPPTPKPVVPKPAAPKPVTPKPVVVAAAPTPVPTPAQPVQADPTPAPTPQAAPVPAPVINEFTVSQAQVEAGDKVTLRWNVSGASRVLISGLGSQAASGELTRPVRRTTTFTLQAINKTQVVRQSQLVKVTAAPVASTSGKTSVIAGEWLHPFGTMTLNVRGRAVTGTFNNIRTGESGPLRGSLSSSSSGSYNLNAVVNIQNSDQPISFVIVFESDSKAFTGFYSGRNARERWCGWRPSSKALQCSADSLTPSPTPDLPQASSGADQ